MSSALRIKPRPAVIFLDALAALGWLVKSRGRFANARVASERLVGGRPGSFGPILKFQDILWEAWGGLDHVLKRGAPRRDLPGWLRGSNGFIEEYVAGMSLIARRPAAEVAGHLHRPGDSRLLDVGGGPGTYSLALLEKSPHLRAEILDLPETIRLAGKLLDGHALRPRLAFRPGDYRRLRLPAGHYDIILLSHVTHNEGPDVIQRMLKQCARALRPGGRLAVHDFMTDEEGTSPAFSAVFSVHMMTFTRSGGVYDAKRYSSWLKQAGLARLARRPIARGTETPSVLVFAER